ncbi:ABC transporter ATP-binding protein [Aureibacillus halotolerans]|uniref:Putative spermidine/putrescine transport system ATP-binding protein n=1 Tax=Aureibacillus halotolerans TaxID=1508390 RepID=A0A4R6UCR9_9BACI|nr:ABC transporter ATP-binding protein [Aureibacillus halotolerans]TDQ42839.1 putative spermidine/putrescine transport system ATP-binding protein [Aureibacillus halotolerans]
MALLTLKDVTVTYNQKTPILEQFNLDIAKGELVSLLGPSGCGKTTTLRLIAGFLEAKSGQFLFDGSDYTKVPVNKRNFGFVFQSYALFPHMTVFDNVAFGLKLRKVTGTDVKKRVQDMLDIVNLNDFGERFPAELSGGQRQRVAIARALVIQPDLLLFDEPLSNLDANLRVNMRVEIRRIQQELGITTVYVSHDQEECFSISDKVAIMNKGDIEQLADPATIFRYPTTEFVARFIGFSNFLHFDSRKKVTGGHELSLAGQTFFAGDHPGTSNETALAAAIRPDDLAVVHRGAPHSMPAGNVIPGTVRVRTFLGRSFQYVVDTAHGSFTVNQEMEQPFEAGTDVDLLFAPERMVLVDQKEA